MNYWEYKKRLANREAIVPFTPEQFLRVPEKISPESIYYPKISLSMNVITFTRNLKTEIIPVTTTASKILEPPHPTCYYIVNPGTFWGVLTNVVIYEGTVNTAGNTQANSLRISDYLNVHLHLTVTDITGTWEFTYQSRDPYTDTWADVQVLGSIDSPGTYYFYIGNRGICERFALAWQPMSAGSSMTFSATVSLKEEIQWCPFGVARAVYLGDKTVTPKTGIPIFEGHSLTIFPEPDIEIWAVAYTDSYIQVFWL